MNSESICGAWNRFCDRFHKWILLFWFRRQFMPFWSSCQTSQVKKSYFWTNECFDCVSWIGPGTDPFRSTNPQLPGPRGCEWSRCARVEVHQTTIDARSEMHARLFIRKNRNPAKRSAVHRQSRSSIQRRDQQWSGCGAWDERIRWSMLSVGYRSRSMWNGRKSCRMRHGRSEKNYVVNVVLARVAKAKRQREK